MIPGFATSEGTGRYVSRFSGAQAAGFFRLAQALNVSSLGIGTYLGNADDRTDQAYSEAVLAALRGGINFIDTAINYRHQRSERAIGIALRQAINAGDVQRDEVVVCTKAGFLTPGAVPPSFPQEEVAGGMHSMAPDFLGDQIDRSRSNLGLDTLDVFYLHNPETQLGLVSRDRFETRVTRVFERLEHLVTEGAIRYYGIATWDGFRKPGALDLGRMAELARSAAGDENHFRFIQLPFNLGMVDAFAHKPQSVLEVAAELRMTVVASATLLQARLVEEMPEVVAELLPGLETNAQRAIQFTRSTPGITVALVGMSSPEHVSENLLVAHVPPAGVDQYLQLYR